MVWYVYEFLCHLTAAQAQPDAPPLVPACFVPAPARLDALTIFPRQTDKYYRNYDCNIDNNNINIH
jgi:hypothetical protein